MQAADQELLVAMVGLFENSLAGPSRVTHRTALVLAALSVGGMVLARTLPNSKLAEAVRSAASAHALSALELSQSRC